MNPFLRRGLAALALLALLSRAEAGFKQEDLGTSSGQFLKLAVGARAVAMGEAFGTLADDGTAIAWNPAALTQISGRSLSLMHASHFQDIYFDFLGYGQRVGEDFAFGLGVHYFNGGPVPETDAAGVELGYFHPTDLALSASLASELRGGGLPLLEGFALGVTGKFIRSELAAISETGALDVGLLSPRLWGDRLRFSAVAQNLVGRLRFDQDENPLPALYRGGGALRVGPLALAADGVLPRDGSPYFAAGAELTAHADYEKLHGISLRAGFNSRRSTGLDESLAGWSFGGGYSGGRLTADYALTPFGRLGDSHRVSLSLRF